MKRHHISRWMLLFLGVVLFGCSGGDGSQYPAAGDTEETGTLSISLTDAPVDSLKAVYVTIEEIEVCAAAAEELNGLSPNESEGECAWQMVAQPQATYNLLELINGVTETLGMAELPAGTYHQLRLKIATSLVDDPGFDKGVNILGDEHPFANYLIDKKDNKRPLKVPSGVQSGIKIVSDFEIEADGFTELILDFDADRSIVKSGGQDGYLLKPVIKLLNVKQTARVFGVVKNSNGDLLDAVSVSAQMMTDSSELMVEASTTTDEFGGYQLLLEKDKAFTIVVFSNQFTPACDLINIYSEDNEVTRDFMLEASVSRTVAASITGAAKNSNVSLSIRKQSPGCGNGNHEIELLHETIALDDNEDCQFSVELPAGGVYTFRYSDGVKESSETVNVEAGEETMMVKLPF